MLTKQSLTIPQIPFVDSNGTNSLIERAINRNMPVLIVGETGTGKTTCLRHLAKQKKRELVRVSVNGSTGVEEIVGKWLLKKGSTVWVNGVLTDAMKKGSWIVFDEINAALPEILFTLHSVLDDDRKLLIAEKDGEIMRPHEEFRFFATMNPCATYAGTKGMNTALLSRFGVVIQMKELPPEKEQEIIVEFAKVDTKVATLLVHAGQLLSKAWKDESIATYCSLRELLQAAYLHEEGATLEESLEATIINKGESLEERNEMRKILSPIKKLEKEKRAISYTMNIAFEKAMRKIAKELAGEKWYRREAQRRAKKEEHLRLKTQEQKNLLWELLERYLKPFLDSLKKYCLEQSQDKERTEDSQNSWKSLYEQVDGRLKEVADTKKVVQEIEEKKESFVQCYRKEEEDYLGNQKKEITASVKKTMNLFEGKEKEEHDDKYELTS